MDNDLRKNFVFGLIIGTLLCLLYWYWQQSTRVEDGALELLDKLKAAKDTLHQAEPTAVAPQGAPEKLTKIKGVGPVFADRLHQSGIGTIAEVAALSPAQLAEILQIQTGRAENILANASMM